MGGTPLAAAVGLGTARYAHTRSRQLAEVGSKELDSLVAAMDSPHSVVVGDTQTEVLGLGCMGLAVVHIHHRSVHLPGLDIWLAQ
jgi:hypothetical protein